MKEYFGGMNFREFVFGHFTGINFRDMGFTENFAAINFRVRDSYRDSSWVRNFAVALRTIFSTTSFGGFKNDLSKIYTFLLKQMTEIIDGQVKT